LTGRLAIRWATGLWLDRIFTRTPPLIDNLELLKAKVELVHNLMEIELASRMIKTAGEGDIEGGGDGEEDPLDAQYVPPQPELLTVSHCTHKCC
jgi:hypothetical protein